LEDFLVNRTPDFIGDTPQPWKSFRKLLNFSGALSVIFLQSSPMTGIPGLTSPKLFQKFSEKD